MPTKNFKKEELKHSKLVITKEEYMSTLEDRLKLGKELETRPVSTVEQLESLRRHYQKWNSFNSQFLNNSFDTPENEYKREYDVSHFGYISFGPYDAQKDYEDLQKDIDTKLRKIEELLEQAGMLKISESVMSRTRSNLVKEIDNSKVFIVHGHDSLSKERVARTISKLGLEPVILHERPNGGKTIIEKFELNTEEIGFAIVILTSDDTGKSKAAIDYIGRARQNVILELGYFIGKIGRDKVLPLYEEGVELPSDLNGIVYVPLDEGGAWQFQLGKELKHAGYEVDLNKI